MIYNKETKRLLQDRRQELPDYLKKDDNQIVGKYWVQCGYTLGPSYCSFGCSHCYLPKNANKVPMIALSEMKRQIKANREMTGEGGNIQITGGDVVDAYLKEGKGEELVEIIRYAVELGMVPMLMTHGQGLIDNPQYFERLVRVGGLRKLSCHIDITQAGRAGFPIKLLKNEKQLNPVRDQLMERIQQIRKATGKRVTAAQTVTVSNKNIHSIEEILKWLISKPSNMKIVRTISFQTEAQVGRTLQQGSTVSPDQVWQKIEQALGKSLPRNQLNFGHPDCNSAAIVVVRSSDGKVCSLVNGSKLNRLFWSQVMERFSALKYFGNNRVLNNMVKTLAVITRPKLLWQSIRFSSEMIRSKEFSWGILASMARGKAKGINIVMHNFIDTEQIVKRSDPVVADRLRACSFRGAVERDGKWVAMPMCELNAEVRPTIYSQKIAENKQ